MSAAIFLLTLALRFIYLFHSPDFSWPHSILYEGDAPIWARWAVLLDVGSPFESDLPFRTPGVAWLLHWMGASAAPFTTIKLLWCVFSAATPAVLYLVLARWFSRRAGLIAAVWCAISYGSFVLANSLNNEAPYALIVVTLVCATLAWIERPTWGLSITLGVLHGAALLLRAEHMLLLAMFVIYAAFRAWRESAAPLQEGTVPSNKSVAPSREFATPMRIIGGSAVVLATVLVVCAPWSIRSHIATHDANHAKTRRWVGPAGGPMTPDPYVVAQPPWTPAAKAYLERLPHFARKSNFAYLSAIAQRNGMPVVDEPDVKAFFDREWGYTPEPLDEWSLVSLKGPLDFALANHPEADGGFSRTGLRDKHDIDATFSLARPSHLRLMNHGYAVGWEYIQADFGRWLTQVGKKMSRFQEGVTLGLFANDWPYTGTHVRHSIDLATPVRGAPAWSIAVLVSMLVGTIVACRKADGLIWIVVVLYKLAITVAFYGYARQAVSIAPVFFALSALGLSAACCCRGIPRWALGTGLALLLAFAGYQAWNPPQFAFRLAQPGGRITDSPQWGAKSFESFDELVLEPAHP